MFPGSFISLDFIQWPGSPSAMPQMPMSQLPVPSVRVASSEAPLGARWKPGGVLNWGDPDPKMVGF